MGLFGEQIIFSEKLKEKQVTSCFMTLNNLTPLNESKIHILK